MMNVTFNPVRFAILIICATGSFAADQPSALETAINNHSAALNKMVDAVSPIRPDPKLTPGATLNVPIRQLCEPGYVTKEKVRSVSESEKRAVFSEYHITNKPGVYEIDHLISLELGGSNDIKNLWPQSYKTQPWNAHTKDKLEDWMAASVRHNLNNYGDARAEQLLKQYQRDIAKDWIAAFKSYCGATPGLAASNGYAYKVSWPLPPQWHLHITPWYNLWSGVSEFDEGNL